MFLSPLRRKSHRAETPTLPTVSVDEAKRHYDDGLRVCQAILKRRVALAQEDYDRAVARFDVADKVPKPEWPNGWKLQAARLIEAKDALHAVNAVVNRWTG